MVGGIARHELACRIVNGEPAWPRWRCLLHTAWERTVDAALVAVMVTAFTVAILGW